MMPIHTSDLRRFDIGTLVTIRQILTDRSITQAARAIGISQPAASNALGRIRRVLGDPLMVRGQGGFVLTGRGQILLDQLSEIIPLLDAVTRAPSFDPSTSDRIFSIGATDHANLLLMPRVMELVRRKAPEVRLSIALQRSGQVDPAEIERSGYDLSVGWLRTLPQYWYSRKLIDDKIVVICSARAEINPDSFSREQFEKCRHVALMTDRPQSQSMVYQAMAQAGVPREVVAWTTNFNAIPLIVARSDLIALFPQSLARMFSDMADIRAVPCPIPLGEYHTMMAWHPRVNDDPGFRWLRSVIVEAATGS